MDITITNNPYQNNNVLSDETFRVAKLNNETKRPHIAKYWETNMPKLETKIAEAGKIVENIASREHSYDVVLGRLGMTSKDYYKAGNVDGFRKLKVNEFVRDKTLNAYEGSTKAEIEKPVAMQEEVNVPLPPVQEEKTLSDAPLRGDGLRSTLSNDLPDTRMSRLEKTGEIPRVNIPADKKLEDYREMFNNNQNQFDERPSLSRVERRNDDYSNLESHAEKVQVGKEAEALNRIANLSPLSQNGNRADNTDLQDAYDRFAASEKKKKDSRDTVIKLEREIAEVKGLLEEKHRREIADLAARTKANEEETLGYTMHSEDLRAQLEELRNQLSSGGMRR